MTTDYETRLDKMSPAELVDEFENAWDEAHTSLAKPIDYERLRIARRVLVRRLTIAGNVAVMTESPPCEQLAPREEACSGA